MLRRGDTRVCESLIPKKLFLSIWWLAAVAGVCTACSEPSTAGTPAIFAVPADTTIALGQSFTVRMEAGNGLVTGRATGDASLFSNSVGGLSATVHVR